MQDLQRKLIDKEASNINKNNSKYNYSPNEHILLGDDVAALYDGEREKEMETMVRTFSFFIRNLLLV
jgi:hypothetical protein